MDVAGGTNLAADERTSKMRTLCTRWTRSPPLTLLTPTWMPTRVVTQDEEAEHQVHLSGAGPLTDFHNIDGLDQLAFEGVQK